MKILAVIAIALILGFLIPFFPVPFFMLAAGLACCLPLLRTSRPITIALLIFLVIQDPLQVLAGGTTQLATAVKHLDELAIGVLSLTLFLSKPSVRGALGFKRIYLAIIGCYVGLIASSLIIGTAPIPAIVDLALFSKPFLLFVIGMSLAPPAKVVDLNLNSVLSAMGLVVLVAIPFLIVPGLYDAYIGDLRPPDERLGYISAQGFFLGPGAFSWFAAATFCLSYGAYLAYNRFSYLFYSFGSALFVVLSLRRKSILVVLSVLLISLVAKNTRGGRFRTYALAGAAAALGATVLAPYLVGLWFSTLTEYAYLDPYSTARSALYYVSLLIARDHFPFGTGLASFGSYASQLYYSDVYQRYGISQVFGLSTGDPEYITDTFWPMVLGEGGLISLVSYLTFFLMLLSTAWRSARSTVSSLSSSFLSYAVVFLLVGSLIESAASHIYGSSMHAALVLVPAGMLWRASYEAGSTGGQPSSSAPMP